MSAQTCTVEMDTHPFSIFDNNAFGTYVDSNLETPPNGRPESMFGYDFLNFDQTTNNTPFLNSSVFQTSNVDPTLVLPPPAVFNGTIPTTYSATSFPPQYHSLISSHNESAEASTTSQPTSITQKSEPTNQTKPRRTRKKKAPLPAAVKEEKRRIFLEKNRRAAQKCREKNRVKWDRIQDQYVDLEAQNKVLKERCIELKDEVEWLGKLLRAHRKCGNSEIDGWVGLQKDDEAFSPADSSSSRQEESTAPARDDSRKSQDKDDDMATTRGSQAEDTSPNHQDIDMSTFIEDDDVPSLASSRKTSAATDSDLDLDPSQDRKVPSPTDSALDLTADANVYGESDGMKQSGGDTIVVQDDELIPDDSIFSIGHMTQFTGQQDLPREGLVIW